MFRKIVLFFAFILAINSLIFAQGLGNGVGNGKVVDQNSYARPVKWERYRVSQSQVSVLFPKLPVFISKHEYCLEEETNTYAAYAEEVVYTLRVTLKKKEGGRGWCSNKKDFDEKSFERRLTELRVSKQEIEESKYIQNELEIVKIKNGITTYWLVNDFKNKRWFELWVSHKADVKPNVINFTESFQISKSPPGIEIGNGADQIYGDYSELPATISTEKEDKTVAGKNGVGETLGSGTGEKDKADASKEDSVKKELDRAIVVHKQQARYTQAARDNNVQGSVTLKVIFLANGGIGSISPVSGLPYGLTEQAIDAAKKIVFLPPKRNGIIVTTTKTVVYSFSIY